MVSGKGLMDQRPYSRDVSVVDIFEYGIHSSRRGFFFFPRGTDIYGTGTKTYLINLFVR